MILEYLTRLGFLISYREVIESAQDIIKRPATWQGRKIWHFTVGNID